MQNIIKVYTQTIANTCTNPEGDPAIMFTSNSGCLPSYWDSAPPGWESWCATEALRIVELAKIPGAPRMKFERRLPMVPREELS